MIVDKFFLKDHNILFLASVADPGQWQRPGGNIPMAKWASGLVTGLRANDVEPLVIGHQYEQSWPGGRLFPGRKGDMDEHFMHRTVRFSNLPFVRRFELTAAYARTARRVSNQSKIDCILTYNPLPWHVHAAKEFQKSGGTWINIVLDYDEKDLGHNWKQFLDLCGGADGQVFLSWWAFENAPVEAKLHLDSGVSSMYFECADSAVVTDGKKRVVYAGKITPYGGSELMANSFRLVEGEDVEFLVCGRGHCGALARAAKEDKRIKLVGFVDDNKLHRICQEASVFFNPRDPGYSNNRMIFPSKILQYMAYGKPIVSTRTYGLSPEYDSVLQIAPGNGAEELAMEIRRTLDLTGNALGTLQERQYAFVTTQRSWKQQASKLLTFIQSLSGNKE